MKAPKLKSILFLVFVSIDASLYSQSVGMNSTGATPSSNAVLDLNTGNSYNQGLIIPHVELGSSLTTFNPPMAAAATTKDTGMIVYNMRATYQPIGYYYWNGSTWSAVGSGSGSGWLLTGNSGTTVGTDYIGTSDANALEFKVDGQKAGWIDYTGPGGTSLGWESANTNSTGINNTAVGYKASYTNSSASRNTSVGAYAMYLNTGSGNTAVGDTALYSNTGNYNTAVGAQSLEKSTANGNTAVGYMAGWKCANGAGNTFLGFEAGYLSTNASNITAVGNAALWDNTAASNTAVGYGVLQVNTTGTNNTAMGCQALGSASTTATGLSAYGNHALYNSTGSGNTAMGDSAGISNTSGTNNTFIGGNSNAGSGTLTNATAIGNGATVAASNSVMIGNSSVTTVSIGAGANVVPVQENTSTSGTVTANGSQILNLTGAATSLTITDETSPAPIEGQLWEITTNQTSISLSYTNSGHFVSAPATVTNTTPARFFYSTTLSKWVNQ